MARRAGCSAHRGVARFECAERAIEGAAENPGAFGGVGVFGRLSERGAEGLIGGGGQRREGDEGLGGHFVDGGAGGGLAVVEKRDAAFDREGDQAGGPTAIGAVAAAFSSGRRTVSMTWITPLLVTMSAAVSLTPLTRTAPSLKAMAMDSPPRVLAEAFSSAVARGTRAAMTCNFKMATSWALFSGLRRDSSVPLGSLAKAASLGAKTVNGPSPLSAPTKSAAVRAAARVLNEPAATAVSTMSALGAVVGPATATNGVSDAKASAVESKRRERSFIFLVSKMSEGFGTARGRRVVSGDYYVWRRAADAWQCRKSIVGASARCRFGLTPVSYPMNTPLSALLERKGPALHTVASSLTIAETVAEMNRHRIGCILVVEGEKLVGIFTERDVLRRVVGEGVDPKTKRVADVMSANVMTVSPEATVEETMVMFAERRCRHLPVLSGGKLCGLISIGDISRWMADAHRNEAEHLKSYIAGGLSA